MYAIILTAYIGLLAIGIVGFGWYAPPTSVPRSLVILVFCLPLLPILRGLVHGRRRSVVWAGFISLFYFAIGVDSFFRQDPHLSHLGAAITLVSSLLFLLVSYWLRSTGKKIRAQKEASDT